MNLFISLIIFSFNVFCINHSIYAFEEPTNTTMFEPELENVNFDKDEINDILNALKVLDIKDNRVVLNM